MQLSEENKHKVRESLPQIHNLFVINLIKALKEGRLPSKAQLELLDKAVAMPEDSPTTPAPAEPEYTLDNNTPEGRAGLAEFYGVNVRTINRWQKMGEQKGITCPVHTPSQMPEWWKAVSKKPVDKHILDAAEKVQQSPAAPAAAAVPAETGKRPSLDLANFNPADYNFDGMLMSMRTMLMAEEHLLKEALASGIPARINQAKTDLRAAMESLRKLEKDSGKILESHGLTLRSADVRAAIAEVHQFIPSRIKAESLSRLRKWKEMVVWMMVEFPRRTCSEEEVRSWVETHFPESKLEEWAGQFTHEVCATFVQKELNFKVA